MGSWREDKLLAVSRGRGLPNPIKFKVEGIRDFSQPKRTAGMRWEHTLVKVHLGQVLVLGAPGRGRLGGSKRRKM